MKCSFRPVSRVSNNSTLMLNSVPLWHTIVRSDSRWARRANSRAGRSPEIDWSTTCNTHSRERSSTRLSTRNRRLFSIDRKRRLRTGVRWPRSAPGPECGANAASRAVSCAPSDPPAAIQPVGPLAVDQTPFSRRQRVRRRGVVARAAFVRRTKALGAGPTHSAPGAHTTPPSGWKRLRSTGRALTVPRTVSAPAPSVPPGKLAVHNSLIYNK